MGFVEPGIILHTQTSQPYEVITMNMVYCNVNVYSMLMTVLSCNKKMMLHDVIMVDIEPRMFPIRRSKMST